MQDYLINRPTLQTVFLLIDGSILPQNIDLDFIYMLKQSNISFDIIISKIDKSNQKNLHKNITLLQSRVKDIV